jgi:hypothetical protein
MKIFYHQKLYSIGLKKEYLPERLSTSLFKKHGIVDDNGNGFALYKSDYLILRNYLIDKTNKTTSTASKEEFIDALVKTKVKIITYFKPENCVTHQLDIALFNKTGVLANKAGINALKDGHQNCLVFYQGKIYLHPKIRSNPESLPSHPHVPGLVGLSHTSYTRGDRAPFVGSFTHDGENWLLENTTGHYGTRATQLRKFVEFLNSMEMDLSSIKVKCWIPKDPSNPKDDEEDYHILIEDALSFLKRTNDSLSSTNEKKSKTLIPQIMMV